jgi:hypothetical protein
MIVPALRVVTPWVTLGVTVTRSVGTIRRIDALAWARPPVRLQGQQSNHRNVNTFSAGKRDFGSLALKSLSLR